MEAKFEKIRGQVNSKQENQILYARTLLAIEETIQEQNGQMVPTAYFGAIMTTLQATSPDNEVAGALVYLLNEVLPNLPQAVVRAKFSDVLPVLEKVYEQHSEEQPVVRSIVGCLQELLVNLDAAMWGIPFAKKSYHLLLVLSANASPKARKGAQDAIRYVLSRPPPPTTVHPTAGMTAEFVLRVLQEATKLDQHAAQQILALLKTIVPYWPPNQFAVLCHTLLQLPKFNNIFLTKATFEVFEALFDVQETDIDQDKFAALLRAICDMKPAAIDERLLPTWLLIVSKAFPAYAKMDASQCAAEIAPVFEVIFDDFRQESRCYRQIANCLSHLVEYCITDDMVQRASNGEANGLTQIISAAERGLGVHYQPAWNDVMTVQQALFRRLHRSAAPLMDECVALLGELRLSPAQSYKEQLDKTLGAAIATMGAENFLAILPLNLETPNSTSNIGRAFLLPLLKSYLTNTSLGYFVNVLIPLADRLHEKGQAAANRELALQAKVYETLVNQIWSLAPGFCDLPTDLTAAFNDQVAERFSSLLYTQPELRPTIAQALQLLVQKNETLKNSAATDEDLKKAYGISKSEAAQNIQHMSKFAVNYLAVFFNVYSQIAPAYRGFLDEVIRSYLGIVSAEEINSTFKKVLGLLSQALQDPNPQKASSDPTALAPMSHTMLDLAVIMIPFLDLESAELLYNGTMTSLLDKKDDPLLQKKGYKVLRHLLSQPVGQQVAASRIAELESKLLQETESCTASARKDRIRTLLGVVSLLPSTDLHFIPAILSEAVLGTKDTSEKTRSFSFSLLIEMGKKMKQGGIIKSSLVEGMEEGVPDATATISEYFTMVTAGLAGTTAHMIAATITSLSRLLFEFKADLSTETVLELLQTMNIFVASTNREIVKAALGYIKVCIVILDSVLIESELGGIIENLLKCSHQTRNQFKPKIRHIFERLIRLFGYERISELVPEEDKKLIANIQKRRLRAKRRKVASEEYQDDDEEMGDASRVSAKKTGAGYHDAYEEVLYGSESELEGSDDETAAQGTSKGSNSKKNKKKKGAADAFIREGDEDNPLDFLDRSALGRITSSKPVQRKTQNLAKNVQYDEEGRLIFKESDSEASDSDDSEEEEDYYMQAQKSADGFVRTARNKIKFKKGVKDDDMADDDDAMDVDQGSTRRKKKGPKYEALGKDYRSKKAKGDVKAKGKADPYAYVPLSKVTKRKGRSKGPKLTFTGKLKR